MREGRAADRLGKMRDDTFVSCCVREAVVSQLTLFPSSPKQIPESQDEDLKKKKILKYIFSPEFGSFLVRHYMVNASLPE